MNRFEVIDDRIAVVADTPRDIDVTGTGTDGDFCLSVGPARIYIDGSEVMARVIRCLVNVYCDDDPDCRNEVIGWAQVAAGRAGL